MNKIGTLFDIVVEIAVLNKFSVSKMDANNGQAIWQGIKHNLSIDPIKSNSKSKDFKNLTWNPLNPEMVKILDNISEYDADGNMLIPEHFIKQHINLVRKPLCVRYVIQLALNIGLWKIHGNEKIMPSSIYNQFNMYDINTYINDDAMACLNEDISDEVFHIVENYFEQFRSIT